MQRQAEVIEKILAYSVERLAKERAKLRHRLLAIIAMNVVEIALIIAVLLKLYF